MLVPTGRESGHQPGVSVRCSLLDREI